MGLDIAGWIGNITSFDSGGWNSKVEVKRKSKLIRVDYTFNVFEEFGARYCKNDYNDSIMVVNRNNQSKIFYNLDFQFDIDNSLRKIIDFINVKPIAPKNDIVEE